MTSPVYTGPVRRVLVPSRILFAIGLLVAALPLPGTTLLGRQAPAAVSGAKSSKIWLDKPADFENFLRSAKVVGMQAVPVGVTKPMRAQLEPGGPFTEMSWKAIRPGRYNGYFESYQNEIAAYELDKLLRLEMVPPTVERRVNEAMGAAVMWVSSTQSFKQLNGVPTPPAAYAAAWGRQLARAKMFDNLIGNIDPNLGNWLVDPAWNIIVIDHTRSFTATKQLVHKLEHVDSDLWDRMQKLTEENLQAAVGTLVDKPGIRAMIQRRDAMQKTIDQLVKRSSEATVFIR